MPEPDETATGEHRSGVVRPLPLSRAWVAAAILVPAIAITALPLQAIDLAYAIRAGNDMLGSGSVLRVDTFTLPAHSLDWLNQQWGAQVVLASVFRVGGWFGLSLLRTLLVAMTAGLVYLACRAGGLSARYGAALTLLGSAFFLGGAALRPQLLGLGCFALVLWLTASRHRRPRVLLLVIPITAVWANLHGSFVLGPSWVLLAALRDRTGGERTHSLRTALIGIAAAAAALANPFGPRVYAYVVDLSSDPRIRGFIQEWRSPTLDPTQGAYFAISLLLLASLAGVTWAIAKMDARPRWPAVVTAIVIVLPAAVSLRGIYWWGMAAVVLVAEIGFPHVRETSEEPVGRHVTVVVGALLLAMVALLARWLPFVGQDPPSPSMVTYAPQAMTRELQTVLVAGEPLFNAQLWGSWFEFALPGHLVFADSRIEVLPAAAWDDYLSISAARPGWQALLERWGIRVIAARNDQQGALISALGAEPGWDEVFVGDGGALFVRVAAGG